MNNHTYRVGQTAISVTSDWARPNFEAKISEETVTKVGRKWVYTNRGQYEIETGKSKENWGHRITLYPSHEAYQEHLKAKALHHRIRQEFDRRDPKHPLAVLEAVAQLLFGVENETTKP